MKLIKTRQFIPIILVTIVLFILGAIFDKDVSANFYVNSSLWQFGVMYSNIALSAFFFILLIAASSGLWCLLDKKNKYSKKIKIIFSIILILGGAYLLYQSFDKMQDTAPVIGKTGSLIFAILMTLAVLGASIYVGYRFHNKYNNRKLFVYVVVFLAIVLVSNGIMEGLKFLWSRPRPWYVFGNWEVEAHLGAFRNVWEAKPFELFKIKEIKDYLKSFPSNHTCNAAILLPGVLLYSKLNKGLDNDKCRTLIILGSFLFTLLMASTRMMAGAHFLSDVSFGMFVGTMTAYFGFIIANKVLSSPRFSDEPALDNIKE